MQYIQVDVIFETIDPESIQNGRVTDEYFRRTEETLDNVDKNPRVTAEITADQFSDGEWEVFAGINGVIQLFERAGIDVEIDSLPEGSLFDGGPVMNIRGRYRDFARYETSLLGLLSHASGIATGAFKVHQATQDIPSDPKILSFGTRHSHPRTRMI